MTCSDIIAICDLAVTGIAGGFIAYYLGKRQSNNRATKDYFVGSITSFSQNYTVFINTLFCGGVNAKDIQSWFKLHTMTAGAIDKSLKKQYNQKVSFDKVVQANNRMKQFVTDTEEFNSQYENPNIAFKHSSISSMMEKMSEINEEIANSIININKR